MEDRNFDRYFELELLHARWAMLGALGALVPGEHRHRPNLTAPAVTHTSNRHCCRRALGQQEACPGLGMPAFRVANGLHQVAPSEQSCLDSSDVATGSEGTAAEIRLPPKILHVSRPCVPPSAEVLQYTGAANFLESRWWNVGAAKLGGEDLNYLGVAGLRIAGGQGILIIAVCQVGPLANLNPNGQPLAPDLARRNGMPGVGQPVWEQTISSHDAPLELTECRLCIAARVQCRADDAELRITMRSTGAPDVRSRVRTILRH